MYYFIHVIFKLKNWVDLVTSWSRESWSRGKLILWQLISWQVDHMRVDLVRVDLAAIDLVRIDLVRIDLVTPSHCSMFFSVCTALQHNRQLHRMIWATFSLPFLSSYLFLSLHFLLHLVWNCFSANETLHMIDSIRTDRAGPGVVWFICHYYKIFMQAFFI